MGQTFRSLNTYETGLGPNGAFVGHWSVTFYANGIVRHDFSDASTTDLFTCDGPEGMIATNRHLDAASYFFSTEKLLLWRGKWYR